MVALVAWSVVSTAQTIVPVIPVLYFPAELKQYLALSDDQVAKINTLNSQLRAFQAAKGERQSQVQREIAEETAKPSPDPMELGVRYFEIEALRRQLDDQQKNTAIQIQALLSADQKTKLNTLQQALSLYSTACTAVNENIMTPPTRSTLVPIAGPGTIFVANLTSPVCGAASAVFDGSFIARPLTP
jgi:hypothetical protein